MNSITITCTSGLSEKEIEAYKNYIEAKYSDREITAINIELDGDYVNLTITFKDEPNFERIQQITGYLVGTLDRFNDGKRQKLKIG